MKRLIRVFDNTYNFMNAMVALAIDIDEVFFIYHNRIDEKNFYNVREVLKKYKKDLNVQKFYIQNDEKEINDLLNENTIVDITTARYLSAYLFEQALKHGLQIVYYDGSEQLIKDYKTHSIICNSFSLKIEDIVKLGGGTIDDSSMHKPVDLSDEKTVNAIIDVVDKTMNDYPKFINYVNKVNACVTHKTFTNNSCRISDDIKKLVTSNRMYEVVSDIGILEVKNNTLSFMNPTLKRMFTSSGTFLENYLYIKLSKSNMFDQVLMSKEIDFSSYYTNYRTKCELDCLTIKNNEVLFISCKSNSVKQEDLNEIKIHNIMFGNDISIPVVCTLEDMSAHSSGIYAKAHELHIAVIDRTSFKKNRVVEDLLSIIDGTYTYEKI